MPTASTKKHIVTPAELQDAVRTWRTFHDKHVRHIRKVKAVWPRRWFYMDAITHIYYSSDKWHLDNDFVDYEHESGPEISMWVSDRQVKVRQKVYCPVCRNRIRDLVKYRGVYFTDPCQCELPQKLGEALLEDGNVGGGAEEGTPPVDFCSVGTVLGESLGFITERFVFDKLSPGDLLCTDPNGRWLFVVDASGTPFVIVEGTSLRVTAAGIEG